jgi:LemA protein
MTQEKEVFGLIADARSRYAGATSTNAKAEAASQLETGLGRLLVVMENYPQLNSNQTVASLMDELAGTENRVAVERKRFNDLVQSYNGTLRMFPTNLVAGLFGYQTKTYFESDEGAQKAPKVDLTN